MPPLFKRGDELGEGLSLNRWKLIRKVGEGQFAEVYEVADALRDNRRVRSSLALSHPPSSHDLQAILQKVVECVLLKSPPPPGQLACSGTA